MPIIRTSPWLERRDRVAPGVNAVVHIFGDGSGSVEFYTGDHPAINQRLIEAYRLNGYSMKDDNRRCGPEIPPLISPAATTLTLGNQWAPKVFALETDIGRTFGPQPWARGLRPLIRAADARKWAEGGHNDLLRYTPGGPKQGMIYARLIRRAAYESDCLGMPLTAESLNEVIMALGYGSLLTPIQAMMAEPMDCDMGRNVQNMATTAIFDPPPALPASLPVTGGP